NATDARLKESVNGTVRMSRRIDRMTVIEHSGGPGAHLLETTRQVRQVQVFGADVGSDSTQNTLNILVQAPIACDTSHSALPKMDMSIHEAWQSYQVACIYDFGIWRV
ncbi:hypothetical protein, partial [Mesorhizobium sp. M4B.F.Ca.ET.200.01.1.1]|uniref:hypothetical protein n=1 Tax=Mesorhizobium sp. M4B.F.Ca.ET.200.01.1.1 TaxID=2563952 RepID=UPI001FDEAD93